MVNLSFCKQQAKQEWSRIQPPVEWGGRPLIETGLPKDVEAAGVLGIRARGGAASRESSTQSWQAASHHKRVNSEVCGRGSFSCRKLEITSKVFIMKWGNQAQRGKVISPNHTASVTAKTWTLVSSRLYFLLIQQGLQIHVPTESGRQWKCKMLAWCGRF